jgi:hypothetical protein
MLANWCLRYSAASHFFIFQLHDLCCTRVPCCILCVMKDEVRCTYSIAKCSLPPPIRDLADTFERVTPRHWMDVKLRSQGPYPKSVLNLFSSTTSKEFFLDYAQTHELIIILHKRLNLLNLLVIFSPLILLFKILHYLVPSCYIFLTTAINLRLDLLHLHNYISLLWVN